MTNDKLVIHDFIFNVCKAGQGAACCKYLLAGTRGLECGKLNEWKEIVDKNWAENPHIAQGDNCSGINGVLTVENTNQILNEIAV